MSVTADIGTLATVFNIKEFRRLGEPDQRTLLVLHTDESRMEMEIDPGKYDTTPIVFEIPVIGKVVFYQYTLGKEDTVWDSYYRGDGTYQYIAGPFLKVEPKTE